MTSFPLDIRLAEDHLSIGPVALRPKGSSLESRYHLFGQPDRVVPLPYNNTVYIYDCLGIHFWADAGIVGKWQLVLEVEPRETFPHQAFVGPIEYQQYVLY